MKFNYKNLTYTKEESIFILGKNECMISQLPENRDSFKFDELENIAQNCIIDHIEGSSNWRTWEYLQRRIDDDKPIYTLKIGFVYFILTLTDTDTDKRLKIGFSQSVHRRFRTIKSSLSVDSKLLGYVFGSKLYEKYLHYKYEKYIAKGSDWFFYTKELKKDINQLIQEDLKSRQSKKLEELHLHLENYI